eukprot:3513643-Pleurochrysis_carterae.AAC.2
MKRRLLHNMAAISLKGGAKAASPPSARAVSAALSAVTPALSSSWRNSGTSLSRRYGIGSRGSVK